MKDALKQRLVGAVVLVAVAVIFLPGLLREQQGYSVDTDSQIPQEPDIPQVEFAAPEQTAEVQAAPAPETMFLPPDDADMPPETAMTATSSESPAEVKATPAPDEETVPDLPLGADGLPEAWVIQVASLSNKEAAEKLRNELQGEGYKAYIRSISTDKGTVTRVFIGPKLERKEAMAIKSEIDKRLKVHALVKRFQP